MPIEAICYSKQQDLGHCLGRTAMHTFQLNKPNTAHPPYRTACQGASYLLLLLQSRAEITGRMLPVFHGDTYLMGLVQHMLYRSSGNSKEKNDSISLAAKEVWSGVVLPR